jgi:D-serine dehydratase
VALNDQHATVELPAATELEVGDLLGCSISHPCGAFDRSRVIPALDDDGVVVDAIATYF